MLIRAPGAPENTLSGAYGILPPVKSSNICSCRSLSFIILSPKFKFFIRVFAFEARLSLFNNVNEIPTSRLSPLLGMTARGLVVARPFSE